MIRINITAEPEWIDLGHGVRVKAAPCSTAIMIAARNDPEMAGISLDAPKEEYSHVFSKAVARRVIVDWEGVADSAGNPVPPTPDGINALLEIYPIFEAFQNLYMAKALLLESEKNGFAPAPNGITAGANVTAPVAKKRAKNARTK